MLQECSVWIQQQQRRLLNLLFGDLSLRAAYGMFAFLYFNYTQLSAVVSCKLASLLRYVVVFVVGPPVVSKSSFGC